MRLGLPLMKGISIRGGRSVDFTLFCNGICVVIIFELGYSLDYDRVSRSIATITLIRRQYVLVLILIMKLLLWFRGAQEGLEPLLAQRLML